MQLLERIISLVAPHNCLSCGREGSLLCNWCQPDACPTLPSRCYRCHKLTTYSKVCNSCRPRTRLSHVWVRTEYEALARELVKQLKFDRNQSSARVIAELMSEALPYLPESTILVHNPTSTKHVRERGYDQAKLLAAELASISKRRNLTLLSRINQVQQVGSKRRERLTQLQGAYRTLKPELIKGAYILLVDDVSTTGATIEQAALVLKQAGAKRVDAVVFAQTQ